MQTASYLYIFYTRILITYLIWLKFISLPVVVGLSTVVDGMVSMGTTTLCVIAMVTDVGTETGVLVTVAMCAVVGGNVGSPASSLHV